MVPGRRRQIGGGWGQPARGNWQRWACPKEAFEQRRRGGGEVARGTAELRRLGGAWEGIRWLGRDQKKGGGKGGQARADGVGGLPCRAGFGRKQLEHE